MSPSILPPDEGPRLADLARLHLLDTPPEERFERLARLAAAALDAPFATISLVDAEREWFKARHGCDARQAPRGTAFSAHALLADAPVFEVPDALLDARFAQNPLVVGEPRVRWYAGRPIRGLGGYRVGALCVLDQKPRLLTPRERQLLEDLAAVAEGELHTARLAELRDELAAANRRADTATRARAAFLAYVSHKLRTPVTTIGAAVELLEDSGLDAKQRRYMGFYRRGANALMELVDNLLDLTASEAGRLQLDARDFDLAELVRSVVEGFEERAVSKKVAVRAAVDPSLVLPRRGDERRLRQVLNNLVGNALKFTAAGEVVVKVAAHPDPDRVAVSVVDTGPGIAAERIESVFDSCMDADPAVRRKHGGSGLGLPIARSIVEAMGGHIQVTSGLGVGSTFTVLVPLPRARGPVLASV